MQARQLYYKFKTVNSQMVVCGHFKEEIHLTLYTIYKIHAKWKNKIIRLPVFTKIPSINESLLV